MGHCASAEGEDAGLRESLLRNDEASTQQDVDTPRKSRRAIILHPGPFDLEAFLRTIIDWFNGLLSELGSPA